jgi:hypothetical protein
MGSGTLGDAGSSVRLMSEPPGRARDENAVVGEGVLWDWREQPRAVTISANAIPKIRLTSIVARYIAARTYAKTTLTLPSVLSRFVRPRTSLDRRTGLGVTHRWRCYICPRSA